MKAVATRLCEICGKRPAVAHYWDKRGKRVTRALKGHDECRQCHRSRTDHDRRPHVEQRAPLRLELVAR